MATTTRRKQPAVGPPPPPVSQAPTKRTKTHRNIVSPYSSLHTRQSVPKDVVDELLLVCGVLGTTNSQGVLVPVEDCWNWLQDLQRALRRDDDTYRPISILLGQWKVVEQKVLPLLLSCRYDGPLVTTLCKILVLLTKPLGQAAQKAARMVIDTKKKGCVKPKYKSITFTHNWTHSISKAVIAEQIKIRQNALDQAATIVSYKRAICQQPEVLAVLVSLLAEPLAKSSRRSDADHLVCELVLHLWRNLLQAGDDIQLHAELIALLHKELVLDILCVVGSQMDQHVQYNLLVMELLYYLLVPLDPQTIAKGPSPKSLTIARPPIRSGRHGNFGGTLVRPKQSLSSSSQQAFVTTTAQFETKTLPQPKARAKKAVFVPSFVPAATPPIAAKVVHQFLVRFLTECYGPLFKSLKNEFRRDSARLESRDKVLFLKLIAFVNAWRRHANVPYAPLVFTLDLFTLQLVLRSIDFYQDHKRYADLSVALETYSELLLLLQELLESSESTEQLMALGLLDHLYYSDEPSDRLPKLLSAWKPGTTTREWAVHAVAVTDQTMRLLDLQAERVREYQGALKSKEVQDTVVRLKQNAARLDVDSYFARKLCTNHVVLLYTSLLGQYTRNSAVTNGHVVTYFQRLSTVKVAQPEAQDQNPLALKQVVTLEPMLYSFRMLSTCQVILNDTTIRKQADYYQPVLDFCATLITNWTTLGRSNPVLYVEALVPHAYPARHCENMASHYVSEELRLLVDREMLLEGQVQLESKDDSDDDSDDGEVEFEDFGVQTVKGKLEDSDEEEPLAPTPRRRNMLADSDDEDDEPATTKPPANLRIVDSDDEDDEAAPKPSTKPDLDSDVEDESQLGMTKAPKQVSSTSHPTLDSDDGEEPPTKTFSPKIDSDDDDEEAEFDGVEVSPTTVKRTQDDPAPQEEAFESTSDDETPKQPMALKLDSDDDDDEEAEFDDDVGPNPNLETQDDPAPQEMEESEEPVVMQEVPTQVAPSHQVEKPTQMEIPTQVMPFETQESYESTSSPEIPTQVVPEEEMEKSLTQSISTSPTHDDAMELH